ncbi:MAG: hypothetical protein JW791_00150 [Nanoarchaeota archaeon]|nr:hypothetical protein [Nanoarchaeota archaeon]
MTEAAEKVLENDYNIPREQFSFLKELNDEINKLKIVELKIYREGEETVKKPNTAFAVIDENGEVKELYVNLPIPAYLRYSWSHMFRVPRDIGDLRNLETLVLEDMGFEHVPNSIINLRLKYFSFKLNSIKELPEINAERLEDFDISYNNLSKLPKSMCEKEGLITFEKFLEIQGNYFQENDGNIILNDEYHFKKHVTFKLEKR